MKAQGLYDPRFEHDSCGVGFVVNIKGKKSHSIVRQALEILLNLRHRVACGCEANTGDGAGILLQKPHAFLKEACKGLGITLPDENDYGVGMIYFSPKVGERKACEKVFEELIKEEGMPFLGWRTVAIDNGTLGPTAKKSEPFVRQVFIGRGPKIQNDLDFERKLYIIRRKAENAIHYCRQNNGGPSAVKIKGGEF